MTVLQYCAGFCYISTCCCWSHSGIQVFVTPWTIACQAPLSMEFSRQGYQCGISFSAGSSQPRDLTQVSHIAGRLFTIWATREAHISNESTINIQLFPPSWTSIPTPTSSHPSRLSQSTSLSSMSQSANSYWLFYIWQCICFHATLSIHPTFSFPTLCPQICSLCLHLHCCPQNRFISRTYLDSMLCFLLSHVWLFLTQWTVACKAPLSMGILQSRIL